MATANTAAMKQEPINPTVKDAVSFAERIGKLIQDTYRLNVNHPDAIQVSTKIYDDSLPSVVFTIRGAPADTSKLIGTKGAMVNSVKALVATVAGRIGVRVVVEEPAQRVPPAPVINFSPREDWPENEVCECLDSWLFEIYGDDWDWLWTPVSDDTTKIEVSGTGPAIPEANSALQHVIKSAGMNRGHRLLLEFEGGG